MAAHDNKEMAAAAVSTQWPHQIPQERPGREYSGMGNSQVPQKLPEKKTGNISRVIWMQKR